MIHPALTARAERQLFAKTRETPWETAEDLTLREREVLRLLDGLIVPDWGVGGDRYGELARELGQSAEAGGLPVLRLPASLLTPEATVTDYARAIGGLFTRDARVASG